MEVAVSFFLVLLPCLEYVIAFFTSLHRSPFVKTQPYIMVTIP
jgi:hypothetical protein